MPMNPTSASKPPKLAAATPAPDAVAAGVSAWMDGDLAFAEFAGEGDLPPEEATDTWHRYHLIGDVLRAGAPAAFVCSDTARDSARAQAFARAIVAQAAAVTQATDALPAETVVAKPIVISMPRPVAMAAPAANDAVFRWKMVAGFASVAAVAAVAWSVVGLGSSPGEGATLATAPVERQLTRPAAPVPLFVASAPEPVWVSTPQGVVLRDARMEELMRAHRQAGGGPALQVPAGFLRAATHDAAQR